MLKSGNRISRRTASTLALSTESGERKLSRVLGQVTFESLNVTINDTYNYECEGNGRISEENPKFRKLLDSDERDLKFLPVKADNTRTIVMSARPDSIFHVFDNSTLLGTVSSAVLHFYVGATTVASTSTFKDSDKSDTPRYIFKAEIGMTAEQFDKLFRYFWFTTIGTSIRVVMGVQSFQGTPDHWSVFLDEPQYLCLELNRSMTADLHSIGTVRQFNTPTLITPGA
jgi:hypothetical protein